MMSSDMPSITALILAKNEAEMLANCIDSVRWCDEIIVIDDDSTDNTALIAENAGARVVSFKTTNFAKKREFALKKAKTDWIFYIDADERVTPRLFQEIAVHLETNQASALRFRRQNRCYGNIFQHGGWEQDYVTRIFKRSDITGWEGSIHESPVFEGDVVTLHTPLEHFTHRNTRDNLLKTADWTPIEAALLAESLQEPVTFFTILRKGVMECIRRGIFKQGYKDGTAGMIEALVQGINRSLVYIQVWELQQKPPISERYQKHEQEIAQLWKQFQQ